MQLLRSLLLCGCTGEVNRCVYKSWNGNRCLCPCHYTTEQTMRLVSAYLSVEQINGFVRNRFKAVVNAERVQVSVSHLCGHAKKIDRKLSRMAEQYIQQHLCDECLKDKPSPAKE
jgi:hypothetical protein